MACNWHKVLLTCLLAFQIALQFPYRFWDGKVQGADFFGHVPPSASQRGLFGIYYDMDPQVKFCGVAWIPFLKPRVCELCAVSRINDDCVDRGMFIFLGGCTEWGISFGKNSSPCCFLKSISSALWGVTWELLAGWKWIPQVRSSTTQ